MVERAIAILGMEPDVVGAVEPLGGDVRDVDNSGSTLAADARNCFVQNCSLDLFVMGYVGLSEMRIWNWPSVAGSIPDDPVPRPRRCFALGGAHGFGRRRLPRLDYRAPLPTITLDVAMRCAEGGVDDSSFPSCGIDY